MSPQEPGDGHVQVHGPDSGRLTPVGDLTDVEDDVAGFRGAGQAIEVIAITMAVYLAISLAVSFGMSAWNRAVTPPAR